MSAEAFADKVFEQAGGVTHAGRARGGHSGLRRGQHTGAGCCAGAALDSGSVYNGLYNSGFVEYFGFMRRDPDDLPDTNLDGFNFWLRKMNEHTLPGEDARREGDAFERIKRAEMLRAFIVSMECAGSASRKLHLVSSRRRPACHADLRDAASFC